MVRLTIREAAEVRGLKNARQLARVAGLQPTSAYPLWNGTAARIDLTTLDKLCETLKVQPGYLFEFKSAAVSTPAPSRKRPSSAKNK
jgi:DNA-binding Xre family transcriptional regulator